MQLAAILLVLGLATPALADEPTEPPRRTPFDRGRFALSLGAGSQTSLGSRYFVVAGGVGYFVLDGVELGLSAAHQFGDGPSISRVSPSLRYIAQPLVGRWPVIPYAGGFYQHWFVGDAYDDVDVLGARTGVIYVAGRLLLGLGVAYERIVSDCTTDCDSIYPDLSISLSL
jgi:hypothetical protein